MASASFTILGCGTSTGVPLPGCNCIICSSKDPKNKRTRCSAWIQTSTGSSIIIDTPADFRFQTLTHGVKKVDAVLYTHAHADHIMGMDDLRGFNFFSKTSIPCYSNKATLSQLKRIFSYIFEPDPNYEGGMLPQLDLVEIDSRQAINVCGLKIQPFELLHGKMQVLGFRIGDLAYATDCNFISEATIGILKGLKTLVLDGLRYEPHRTHFTIPQALEAAAKIGAETTYLTHLTHSIDYQAVSASLPVGVKLAYDGLRVEVDEG